MLATNRKKMALSKNETKRGSHFTHTLFSGRNVNRQLVNLFYIDRVAMVFRSACARKMRRSITATAARSSSGAEAVLSTDTLQQPAKATPSSPRGTTAAAGNALPQGSNRAQFHSFADIHIYIYTQGTDRDKEVHFTGYDYGRSITR